jgi:hypothetical protein
MIEKRIATNQIYKSDFSKSLKYGLLVCASLELSEGQEGKAIIDLKKCRHGCAWQH